MQPVVLVLDLVVALVAAADLASLRGAGRFRVLRQCSTTCSLGQPQQVTLALENMTRRGSRLRLRDDVPAVFTADPAEFRVDVPGRSRVDSNTEWFPADAEPTPSSRSMPWCSAGWGSGSVRFRGEFQGHHT